MHRSTKFMLLILAGIALPISASARTYPYPSKPIRVITPFSAGTAFLNAPTARPSVHTEEQ